MKTECGLIGAFITNPVSKESIWHSLHQIQHRGQDSYGYIVINDSKNENGFESKIKKEKGLLPDLNSFDYVERNNNFTKNNDKGILFLGHTRYSTNTTVECLDTSLIEYNIQPVEICKEYGIYMSHNGNLPNLKINLQRLGLEQYYKHGISDTYLFKLIWNIKIMKRLEQNGKTCALEDILEYLKYILMNIVGAYSCVMTFCEPIPRINNRINDSFFHDTIQSHSRSEYKYYLLGFRDRYGYKPLSIGKLTSINNSNQSNVNNITMNEFNFNYCFISESVQLQDNAYYIRDVEPGEIWCSYMNKEPYLLGRINDNMKQTEVTSAYGRWE